MVVRLYLFNSHVFVSILPFLVVAFCKEIFLQKPIFFYKNVKINRLFFTFGGTYGGKYVV